MGRIARSEIRMERYVCAGETEISARFGGIRASQGNPSHVSLPILEHEDAGMWASYSSAELLSQFCWETSVLSMLPVATLSHSACGT